jgi:hypothetical protein
MRHLLPYAAVACACLALSIPASAEENLLIEDYFSMRWFETEIIIFERPQAAAENSVENLILDSPRAYPEEIRILGEDNPYRVEDLDALTRLCLAPPPTLTYTVTPPQEVSDEDNLGPTGIDAGGVSEGDLTSDAPETVALPVPVIFPEVRIVDDFARFLQAVAELESDLLDRSYRYLPADQHQLSGQANRLTRRQGVRVLMHERWLQPVPERHESQPILVQRGIRLDKLYQLEGTIDVTIGRFLHLHANLWRHTPGLGMELLDLPVESIDGGPEPLQMWMLNAQRYVALNESRRMRSGELHYLDHPHFGVLVRIDPVALPQDLLARFEVLEEGDE